jgi:hypothetical protein
MPGALQRAEPTLQRAGGGEGVGVTVDLERVHALEGEHLGALGLVEPGDTGDARLAVDEHRAAAALTRRRATVLRGRDPALDAQRVEEVLVVVVDGDLVAVEGERRHVGDRPFGSVIAV